MHELGRIWLKKSLVRQAIKLESKGRARTEKALTNKSLAAALELPPFRSGS
jgi:hypothetical protein